MGNKADKESDVDDVLKDADKMVKKLTDKLGDLDKLAKNFNSIKELGKKFAKIGKYDVVVRMMSNGISTIEYLNKEDQKKHFDSLTKK